MNKKTALISGSFDPITKGHEWVILESLKSFNNLFVVIGNNPAKNSFFNYEERLKMINDFIKMYSLEDKITTISNQQLYLVDLAASLNIDTIIRGVRNLQDQDYENQIIAVNRVINPKINTIILQCPKDLEHVSSSMVKSLVGFLGWERVIRNFVSNNVYSELLKKHHQHEIMPIIDIILTENFKSNEISIVSKFENTHAKELIELIFKNYCESHRYYHSLKHISELFSKLNLWNLNKKQIQILSMAIIFHDIVYDPKSTNNEELSNELFLQYFEKYENADRVSKLILATKNHSSSPVGEDPLLDIFLDLDLSILGSAPIEYENYEKNIKEEYNFVPESIFTQKRAEIMKSLQVPYRTVEAQTAWGLNRANNLAKYSK